MSTMLLCSMQNVAITTVRFLTEAAISKPCFPSLVICYITRNQQSSLITTVQQPEANQFADYFMSKIMNIKSNMQLCNSESTPSISQAQHRDFSWTEFVAVSDDDLKEIITKSPCPSSSLDPMPSWIVKQHLNTLLPQSLR